MQRGEQRTAIPPRTVVPSPRLADRAPCAGPSANHAIAPFPQHDVTQRRNSLSTIRRGMRTRPALSCKGSVPPRASNTEFPASQPPSMAGVLLPSFCLPSLATAAPGPARSTGGAPRHTFATTFRAGAARLHSSTLALLRGAGRPTAGQPSFFPYPRRHHAGGILQNTCSAANSTSISCHTGQGLTCQPGTAISAVIPSMLGPPNALFRLDRQPRNRQHPAQHLCGTSPLL